MKQIKHMHGSVKERQKTDRKFSLLDTKRQNMLALIFLQEVIMTFSLWIFVVK